MLAELAPRIAKGGKAWDMCGGEAVERKDVWATDAHQEAVLCQQLEPMVFFFPSPQGVQLTSKEEKGNFGHSKNPGHMLKVGLKRDK